MEKNFKLREFAREIGKSPTFVVMLEKDEKAPPVKEETLQKIAGVLGIDLDALLAAASKMPNELKPRDELELALYRQVRNMNKSEKEKLHKRLSKKKEK